MEEGYNENYTEEEIHDVREYIEGKIQNQGIISVAETLIDYIDSKAMEEYLTDKDETMKNKYKDVLEKIKKIGEVFQTDDYLHDRMAEIVEDMEYDKNDNQSREKAVETLISAVEILSIYNDTNGDFTSLYNVTSKKMKNVNFKDFVLIYSNSDIGLILSNENFADTIVEKIKKMSKPEFIYFLLTTSDKTYKCNPKVANAKRERVEEYDDDLITEVYNYSNQYEKVARLYNGMYVDKVKLILDNVRDPKSQLEIFATLNDLEFLRYLTNFEVSMNEIPKHIYKSEEFTKKINGLSKESLIFVADLFYEDFNAYINTDLKNPSEYITARKIKPILSKVYGRILKEKLVDKKGHINYSSEEMQKAQKQLELLRKINETDELPYKYIIFSIYGNKSNEMDDEFGDLYDENESEKDDEDIDVDVDLEELEGSIFEEILDELDEEEMEKSKLKDFLVANDQLQEYLSAYFVIDKLTNTCDEDIITNLMRYNSKNTEEQAIEDDSETDDYILNYCKKRILSLRTPFKRFLFPVNENGCLNDAIDLNTSEMQKNIETFEK